MNAAIRAGEQIIVSQTAQLSEAATVSGDPLLFYTSALAALLGHIGAALGSQAVDSILQVIGPVAVRGVQEQENTTQH